MPSRRSRWLRWNTIDRQHVCKEKTCLVCRLKFSRSSCMEGGEQERPSLIQPTAKLFCIFCICRGATFRLIHSSFEGGSKCAKKIAPWRCENKISDSAQTFSRTAKFAATDVIYRKAKITHLHNNQFFLKCIMSQTAWLAFFVNLNLIILNFKLNANTGNGSIKNLSIASFFLR